MAATRIEGWEELRRELKALGPRLAKKVLRSATRKGAGVIRREIRARVPVRTGRGRKAIRARVSRGVLLSSGRAAYDIGFAPRAFYLKFQEKGTRHHAARPFLRPGFAAAQAQAQKTVGEELAKGLAAEARGIRARVGRR